MTSPPSATLPTLQGRWVAELLGAPIPAETNATCDECAMCAPGGAASAGPSFFAPDVKCCSYLPSLPNFLVGRILDDAGDDAPTGRQTTLARLDARIGATPLGLAQTPAYQLVYLGSGPAFGRSRKLLCPHFTDDARCSIWRHREATCTTWFCKHVRGAVGERFWQGTLRPLLGAVERQLARRCVLELDLGVPALERLHAQRRSGADPLDAEELDGTVDDEAWRATWGAWAGREREFFVECGRRVERLSWDDVLALGGQDVRALARLVRAAHADLVDGELPGRLCAGPFETAAMDGDTRRIVTYSKHDPLDLPRQVLDVLHHFDGRPRAEVARSLAEEEELQLDDVLVRRLVDFDILIPAVRLTSRASS